MSEPDYYAVLGVAPTATSDAISRAYRTLAKVRHPDRGGTHALMAQLNEARDVLLDEAKRRAYDDARRGNGRRQKAKARPSAPPPPPQPAPPDPLEARVRDVLRLYQQGDIAAAAVAMDDLWDANRTSLLCGRARVVTALKYGSVLLDEGDLDAATAWLDAADEPIGLFDELRGEDALTRTATELRGRIAAWRAARARQEADTAAAAAAEAMHRRLAEQEAERRQRRRALHRKVFVAAWALASALTYYVTYQGASSRLDRSVAAAAAHTTVSTQAPRRERIRTAGDTAERTSGSVR